MKTATTWLIVFALVLAAGCPKGGGTGKQSGISGPPSDPQAPPVAANPQAMPEAKPAGPVGIVHGTRLELGGLYLGQEYLQVKAQIQPDWRESAQWAEGQQEVTGIVNLTGPAEPPQNGMIKAPEIVTYAFLEGKLCAMLRVVPNPPTDACATYIKEMTIRYVAPDTVLPAWALECQFLAALSHAMEGDICATWYDNDLKQVLALHYSPVSTVSEYFLVDPLNYDKVIAAMMAAPAGTPPPATPPAGT